MTSETFKDVLCKVSQSAENDSISYNDFLPSEDLYAVLADMELGCDNINTSENAIASLKPQSQSFPEQMFLHKTRGR